MSAEIQRLSKQKLQQLLIDALGDKVKEHSDIKKTPLLVDLVEPYPLRMRIYIFNCTNPPGGRALDEYKIQIILPGQARGSRGELDFSDGRMPLLVAYARIVDEEAGGVFVLWDPFIHKDFSYSANMQVKSETIIKALSVRIAQYKRSNGEIILASQADYLLDMIKRRVAIMREGLLEE